MAEHSDGEFESELSLDDLDEAAGGTIVKLTRFGRTSDVEYSCPRCWSRDLEGITDGASYASFAELNKAIARQTVRCRNCGFEDTGGSITKRTWPI